MGRNVKIPIERPHFRIDLEFILTLDNLGFVWNKQEGLNEIFTHFRVVFKCVS